MNKKANIESEQAIELTAKALGKTDTSSSPSANGQTAAQMEVEFQQVRELGRVIRDSSAMDAERWASPDDAVRLKELIESEFLSGKSMSTDNIAIIRLAALAATFLLMAGIGYVLYQNPSSGVNLRSGSNIIRYLEDENPDLSGFDDSREAGKPGTLESLANSVSSKSSEPAGVGGDAMGIAISDEGTAKYESDFRHRENTIAPTPTDNPVTNGNFDSQGRANDPAVKFAELSPPIAADSDGTTVVLPTSPDTNVHVPDGGKSIFGGSIVGGGITYSIEPQSRAQTNSAIGNEKGYSKSSEESGSTPESGYVLKDGEMLLGNGADYSIVPFPGPNGIQAQLLGRSETKIASATSTPERGTLLPGGINSIPNNRGPVVESHLATPDLDIPFNQNSFGASGPPQIGGIWDSNGQNSNASGEPGLALGLNNESVDSYQLSGQRQVRRGGDVDLGEILDRIDSTGSAGTPAESQLLHLQSLLGAEHPAVSERGKYAYEMSELREVEGDLGVRIDYDQSEQPTNEQYTLPPENRFLAPVGEQALSTFSIDVDTASYANIRRFITNGQLPPGNAVRIEEMVNYFSYDYPQPVDGKPFSVSLHVAQCPWQPANKLVRVGIQGREIPRDDRPPSNLVFLIDVSGSMSDENKLPLLQRSMLMLVDQLTENDRVSIVTYASNAGIRLQPTSGDQKQIIRDVINSLSSGGSTHGSAGISTAYELATQHFIEGGTNRVLLATDGDLNVGVTEDDDLVQLIKARAESGVFLTVLGFGTGNLKDGKLEKIADNGNGQYSYIDSIREAQKVLVSEMSGSLVTIAKDVKLQIEFNPAEVAGYRLIGYENRALNNEDFANDRVDAGDIGAGHSVTALYEIVPVQAVNQPKPAATIALRYQRVQAVAVEQPASVDDEWLTDEARSGELMVVALEFKQPEESESDLLEVTVKDSSQSFDAAPADFQFAASVAAFGMKLRQSAYTGYWTWSDIENTAVATIGNDPQGHRAELVDLVRQTRKLLGR